MSTATLHTYEQRIRRLSEQSVRKHFDAYEDVAWDDPAMAVDCGDPRWELSLDDELGATEWYRAQPAEVRRQIGLYQMAGRMKIGWQFENILQRGLLTFAEALPNRAAEFRYAHHEIIEESQHSLMFQEFVDRSGLDIPVFPLWMRLVNRPIIGSASWFPEMFFLHVLSGEEPIDFLQRRLLQSSHELHPLVRRLCQIHVMEEARHVCFAREYLRRNVPLLGPVKRAILRAQAPFVFAGAAMLMLQPHPEMVRRFAIPHAVMRAAYAENPTHQQLMADSLVKVRRLCEELDLLPSVMQPVWRLLAIA